MVSSGFPHHGEEDCLRGWGGSGTIFFSNCNLRCIFCQNFDISHQGHGRLLTKQQLPGGLDETRQILRFLAREVSPNTFVNVMPQYRPVGLASRCPTIAQSLTLSEFQEAVVIAREEGLRRLARG